MTNIARAFVIALTLTGANTSIHTGTASAQLVQTKSSFFPVPMCPPNDPNACGMGKGQQQ